MPTRYTSAVFNLSSTVDNVVATGENTMVSLYGGKPGKKNLMACATKATVQPQNLSPTSVTGRYHSLRVYLQVKQWKCEDEGMSLEDWGWNVMECGQCRGTACSNSPNQFDDDDSQHE